MKSSIFFLCIVMTIFHPLNGFPIEFLNLNPFILAAPISQVQMHHRSMIQHDEKPDKVEQDYVKLKPKSYQMYFYTANEIQAIVDNKLRSRHEKNTIKIKPVIEEDQLNLPSDLEHEIRHPKVRAREPKSLQISFDPGLGGLAKLDLKDMLLDTIQKETVDKPKYTTTTVKPKRPTPTTKRPKLSVTKASTKPPTTKQVGDEANNPEIDQPQLQTEAVEPSPSPSPSPSPQTPPFTSQSNILAGQSQVGNRESQMIIKPTVIVNIRGTVTNTDGEIRLESRANTDEDDVQNLTRMAQSVFNINQEINIDKTYAMLDDGQDVKTLVNRYKSQPRLLDDETAEETESTTFSEEYIETEEVGGDSKVEKQGKSAKFEDSFDHKSLPVKIYVFEFGPMGGFKNV